MIGPSRGAGSRRRQKGRWKQRRKNDYGYDLTRSQERRQDERHAPETGPALTPKPERAQPTTPAAPCRCGWTGQGAHPCHRCGAPPAKQRWYVPTMRFALVGAQLKFSARDTFACEMCWAAFLVMLEAQHEKERLEVRRMQQTETMPHEPVKCALCATMDVRNRTEVHTVQLDEWPDRPLHITVQRTTCNACQATYHDATNTQLINDVITAARNAFRNTRAT